MDQSFWDKKWLERETGWDVGYTSPPIEDFLKNYPNKNAKILIPGCGNAHEAVFLQQEGFTNITILDIAPKAVEILQEKFQDNPEIKVICGDFFTHEGQYDLMIEQTFFCAIMPELREKYVSKSSTLLKNGGKIIGVLFDTQFEKQGPPFGGNSAEYTTLFEDFYDLKTLEKCYNSIPERQGKEVFVHFIKK